jgi:hypothetical protein
MLVNFGHEDLDVWIKAVDFAVAVIDMAFTFDLL